MRILLVILLVSLANPFAVFARPYVLPDTEVHGIKSAQTGANYELFISLPPGYRTSQRDYPVVFILDADYAFAIVRNIARNFIERDRMVPVILVAIANPGATDSRALYKESRTRDYTPVPSAGGAQAAEFRSVSGGAERFRAFISKELVPFVQRHFRTDPNDRTIIGHSYGGLFASHAMLAEPSLFRRYIIISPSLWYANRTVLSIARAGAGPAAATGSVAYFAVGAREQSMMKDDLDALVKVLRRRSGRYLKLRLQLFPHDDHDSIFPAAVAQGLLAVFPPPPRVNKP